MLCSGEKASERRGVGFPCNNDKLTTVILRSGLLSRHARVGLSSCPDTGTGIQGWGALCLLAPLLTPTIIARKPKQAGGGWCHSEERSDEESQALALPRGTKGWAGQDKHVKRPPSRCRGCHRRHKRSSIGTARPRRCTPWPRGCPRHGKLLGRTALEPVSIKRLVRHERGTGGVWYR